MKRVISGILAMLIVLPSLEITSGINGATASLPLGGLEMLHMQALTGGSNSSAFDASLQVGVPEVKQLTAAVVVSTQMVTGNSRNCCC